MTEYLQELFMVVFGSLLSLVGVTVEKQKQKAEDRDKYVQRLAERIIKIESESVSDKEVRAVFKDYFEPVSQSVQKIQKDVTDIKIQIARGRK